MISELRPWVVGIDQIPPVGLECEQIASGAQCAGLAKALDVLSMSQLRVSYKIMVQARGVYELTGRVQAQLCQACVVTLDPVEVCLDQPFEVRFVPGRQGNRDPNEEQEILAGPICIPIQNDEIDIGAQVFEIISSSLDPYPRKEGVVFDPSTLFASGEKGTEDTGPFAALSKLKGDAGS